MRNEKQKRLEFSSVILAIIIAITGFTYYLVQAQDKTLFAKKQLELRNLATLTFNYSLSEGSTPKNPSRRNSWCEVDAYYGKKRCLGELERDGYITALPISPDENPYYYKYERGVIYVGTPIPNGYILKSVDSCIGNNNEVWWCYKIR